MLPASRPCSSAAPAGGGFVAAPRHSTNTRPAAIVAASSSGPHVPPTELRWAPAFSHSRRTIGSRASVQHAMTSAPRTAASKESTTTALGWRAASALALSGSRRSEEHTSELQSRSDIVCRLLLEKKKTKQPERHILKKKKKKQQNT